MKTRRFLGILMTLLLILILTADTAPQPIQHQYDLLLMLPYILTIIALIFASKNAEFPSAYTIPYSRMER